MTYEEQLRDDRWLTLRQKILRRDMNMCRECSSNKNLQVHHTKYIKGRMAWEYSGWDLKTLCADCHRIEHGIEDQKYNYYDENYNWVHDPNDPFSMLPVMVRDFKYFIKEMEANGKTIY